jgi:hypothetical protein
MARQRLRRNWWAQLIGACAVAVVFAAQASAQVIRTFDSVPVEDSLIAADKTIDVDFVGTGGKLSNVTPPGGGSSSFSNANSTGYGMDANTYGGAYRIWGANLQAGLGTTSLTNFTIAYAYKPDSPNHPDTNKATRQLRMFDSFAGNTSLTISYSGRRQNVALSQFNPADSSTVSYDFGTPPAGLAPRLMDGDVTTIPSGGGTYNANNATEWVFFAMTYEATDATHARVTEYGQVAGTALTQIYQSAIIDMSTNSQGSTFDISHQALDLGNALFDGPQFRPYDGYFDNFGFYSSALPLEQLTALGNAVFTAPPSIAGDYNNNGVVDAADYVIWRNNENTNNVLPNDSIGGTIGTGQYSQWRSHFGQSGGSGLGSSAAVPEPASAVLLIAGALLAMSRRTRSRTA